jgi:UDP-N-acetylglucosamine/UDP-N-acetylgalactosamine diphosphorylase
VDNCQLGAKVSLKGGYVSGSVFLDGSSAGNCAHIRPGCIFEEQASTAHSVGCKQTILFPFVTLGSLINFCDVLMAGGTSRSEHSEVGSSFIHFNFTPHADKATPSLFGDVSRGVLLDQSPIFLGGQGGVVGPVEMEYGVVQAAGSVCRRDLDQPDHLYQSSVTSERWHPYKVGSIRDPERKLMLNLTYIGNLRALWLWYFNFRRTMMCKAHVLRCLDGAEDVIKDAIQERLKQLNKWVGMVPRSENVPDVFQAWGTILEKLESHLTENPVSQTLTDIALGTEATQEYLTAVRQLSEEDKQEVRKILTQVVCGITGLADPHV